VLFRSADKLTTVKSFTQKMQEQGFILENKDVAVELIRPDEAICDTLGLRKNELALCLSRTRMVNDDIIMYSVSNVPASFELPTDVKAYGSLYSLLNIRGIMITHAEEMIEATLADPDISLALQVPLNAAVLKRTRISKDATGRNVEFTVTHYRSDRYKYIIDLSL
jgi:GntR family transcriptional regulator